MADQNASVFDMTDFTVTRRIPQNYIDDVKVPIDQGAASGSRITGPDFLTGILPGQEQVLIHSGDQSIHIDKTQWVRIKEKRNTEVGQEEQYRNKAEYYHIVDGPYFHRHHNTTTEIYDLDTSVDYHQHVKVTEHQGDTRVKYINEKIIIKGTQDNQFYGDRSFYIRGKDMKWVEGNDRKLVFGTDTKIVNGMDSAITLPLKNSISYFETKLAVYEHKFYGGASDFKVFKADVKGFLLRAGGLCAKAVGAAIGSIRF
jgi:hypothetical protein